MDLSTPPVIINISREVTSLREICMEIPNIDLVEGNEYNVWMSIEKPQDIIGFQFGMTLNKNMIEITDVSSPFAALNADIDYSTFGSELRVVHVDAALNTTTISGEWIAFKIKAKSNGQLADAILGSIDNLPAQLVDPAPKSVPFKILIGDKFVATNEVDKAEIELIAVPNPSRQDVRLHIKHDLNDTDCVLKVFTSDGRQVYQENLFIPTGGALQIHIPEEYFSGVGLYYAILENNGAYGMVEIIRL